MYSLSSRDILGWLAGELEEVNIHRMNQRIPKVPVVGARGDTMFLFTLCMSIYTCN